MNTKSTEHSNKSSYMEKLVEHLLVSELIKHSWLTKKYDLQISTPQVDNAGYDLIMEANGFIRHVQIKSSRTGAKTSRQKVHIALEKKPSACVIWVYVDEMDLSLDSFLFFGNAPGEKLPSLKDAKTARHTKGDAQGYKAERPDHKVINRGQFDKVPNIVQLYEKLFGDA